jgi:tetratricopeptide (TPR) repeat protein
MNRTELFSVVVSLALAAGLMGWIIWSQRPPEPVAEVVQAPPGAAAPAEAPSSDDAPEPLPIDEDRAAALRAAADEGPGDVQVRVDLGNLYHQARRFDDAIPWFEAALALSPDLVEVSTDLGVAYYYAGAVDRALARFDRSLEIDPAHAGTLLNIGIVRAFGRQDLAGAIEAWEELQRLAPDSLEAFAAAEAIERLRAVHP